MGTPTRHLQGYTRKEVLVRGPGNQASSVMMGDGMPSSCLVHLDNMIQHCCLIIRPVLVL